MISQVNSSAIRNAYQSAFVESKEATKKEVTKNISQQGDTSKIEQLKEAVNSGEYKVNLHSLSKKITEEML